MVAQWWTLVLLLLARVCRNTLTFLTPLRWVVHIDTQVQKFSLKAFSHTSLHPFLQVTASFSLSRLPGGVSSFGSEFSCDVTRGKVAPGGSRRVSVTYSPAVVDTVSVEYLSLNCKGALSESLLKLSGRCIGKRPRHKGKLSFFVSLVKHMCTPKAFYFQVIKGR